MHGGSEGSNHYPTPQELAVLSACEGQEKSKLHLLKRLPHPRQTQGSCYDESRYHPLLGGLAIAGKCPHYPQLKGCPKGGLALWTGCSLDCRTAPRVQALHSRSCLSLWCFTQHLPFGKALKSMPLLGRASLFSRPFQPLCYGSWRDHGAGA